jgi:hypothetical protein
MIRPFLALVCCIAAGCQSDVPEETYDVNHPFDRVLVVQDSSSTSAQRARTGLESIVRQHANVPSAVDALATMGIRCLTSGRSLRCTYVRHHNTRGKGLVQRWRYEFVADVEFGGRIEMVRRVCIAARWINPPAGVTPGDEPRYCDES